ncbi:MULTISPECIES: SusC/RagA family TonB-linked outer membrane protein [unclassified Carboxylicivirga]|uniref:SusC/RagA family TonB-linked outer membrane protein n=1 Tax=Carboxylicivirga TaxID=1628153 RepID=UPI003D330757
MINVITKYKIKALWAAALILGSTCFIQAQEKDSVEVKSSSIIIPGNQIVVQDVNNPKLTANVPGNEISLPETSVNNLLFGRVPGLIAVDQNGEPGNNIAQLLIRGKASFSRNEIVVFVDGFQVDMNYFSEMTAQEIECIEVLKDGHSLASFGMRGANGVLWVTTKRGQIGKPVFNVNLRGGMQQLAYLLKPLGREQYASLYNEAFSNDNGRVWSPVYDNTNMANLPDVDWFDEVLKESSSYYDANVSVNGGTEKARYYINFGYVGQNGFYDIPTNDTLANSNYQRFNMRANVDVQLLPFMDAKIDVGGRIVDKKRPNRPYNNLWNEMATYPNMVYPARYEDGTWPGTPIHNFNPLASINALGRRSTHERTVQFNFELKQRLDMILEGLYASQAVSLSSWTRDGASNTRNYARYFDGVKQTTDEDTPYERNEDRGQNQWNWQHFSASIGYTKQTGLHSFDALTNILYNTYNTDISTNGAAGKWTEYNYLNWSGVANYAYGSRYSASVSFAAAASDNYHESNRWHLYPALALGWNISSETFLKDMSSIDLLKLTVSAGKNGFDPMKANRNLYKSYYYNQGGIRLGDPNSSHVSGMMPMYIANEGISPEESMKYDLGLQLGLFKHFELNAALFVEKRKGIVSQDWTLPPTAGITNPQYVNIGEVSNKGFDLELNWSQTINDFSYSVGAMAMYYKNNIDRMAEVVTLPALARTNKEIGVVMGYEAIGFYDVDDFDQNGQLKPELPRPSFGQVQPGDIKYRDLLEDNVIDDNDKSVIGNPIFPEMVYSFNAGIAYKGFDVFVLFEGTNGSEFNLLNIPSKSIAFRDFGTAYPIAQNRWAYYPEAGIDTRSVATFPRLSLDNNNHNYQNSTVWMADGDYLRMRNLVIGYTLPESLTQRWGISKMRFELTGMNLLTISKSLDEFDIDPTAPDGHPVIKSYNLGCSLTF